MKSALCSSCKGEIIWARMQGGKMMPVDAEPSLVGTIVLDESAKGAPLGILHAGPPKDGERRHVSHFATCPNAATHRKNR